MAEIRFVGPDDNLTSMDPGFSRTRLKTVLADVISSSGKAAPKSSSPDLHTVAEEACAANPTDFDLVTSFTASLAAENHHDTLERFLKDARRRKLAPLAQAAIEFSEGAYWFYPQGEHVDAIDSLTRAAEKLPAIPRAAALLALGRSEARIPRIDVARARYQAAARIKTSELAPIASLYQATLATRTGDFGLATETLDEARDLTPDSAPITQRVIELAAITVSLKHASSSASNVRSSRRVALEKAIERIVALREDARVACDLPRLALIESHLGNACRAMMTIEKKRRWATAAARAFTRSARLFIGSGRIRSGQSSLRNLAVVLHKMDQPDLALVVLHSAIDRPEPSDSLDNWVRCLCLASELEAARNNATRAYTIMLGVHERVGALQGSGDHRVSKEALYESSLVFGTIMQLKNVKRDRPPDASLGQVLWEAARTRTGATCGPLGRHLDGKRDPRTHHLPALHSTRTGGRRYRHLSRIDVRPTLSRGRVCRRVRFGSRPRIPPAFRAC